MWSYNYKSKVSTETVGYDILQMAKNCKINGKVTQRMLDGKPIGVTLYSGSFPGGFMLCYVNMG
jgi:hypothetical protein